MRLEPFAKAVALLLWADEKITDDEMLLSKDLFTKYGFSWEEAKPVLEGCLEAFVDPGDEAVEADEKGEFVDVDEDLELGCLDFGDGVDTYEVIRDLCRFVVLDKQIDFKEIEIIHHIAEACNLDKVLATAALLGAVQESGSKLNL